MDDQARAEVAVRQVRATEQLGGLGSYDWDVVSRRLVWSDELFRIYGEEPGAFEPTYEGFLDRVHPDDRERIQAVHAEALRTSTSFQTEERIVRSDGEVRTLLTNGMVLTDDGGDPVRLHGVCRDVTEERLARELARRAADRFEALVEAAPDAIVVVDRDGRITSVNPQAERFFGYTAAELVGMSVDALVPGDARADHASLRRAFAGHPTARPMAAGTDLQAVRADGTLVEADIALTPLGSAHEGVVAAFVRDATRRRQAEHDRRRVAEAQMRRRQALELNDNVIQGLVALLWELDVEGVPTAARAAAERTLVAARTMMSDLLDDLPDDRDALIRTSQVSDEPTPPAVDTGDRVSTAGAIRIVIADDAPELRRLLSLRLRRLEGVEIVGEARDGQQAVELCELHRPHIALLDLSMPVLDGLQATTMIRDRLPETRIYVLSGYPDDIMRERAVTAGADAYFEKSGDLTPICAAVAQGSGV